MIHPEQRYPDRTTFQAILVMPARAQERLHGRIAGQLATFLMDHYNVKVLLPGQATYGLRARKVILPKHDRPVYDQGELDNYLTQWFYFYLMPRLDDPGSVYWI